MGGGGGGGGSSGVFANPSGNPSGTGGTGVMVDPVTGSAVESFAAAFATSAPGPAAGVDPVTGSAVESFAAAFATSAPREDEGLPKSRSSNRSLDARSVRPAHARALPEDWYDPVSGSAPGNAR